MKPKKLQKKLNLNKKTVANLGNDTMQNVQAGIQSTIESICFTCGMNTCDYSCECTETCNTCNNTCDCPTDTCVQCVTWNCAPGVTVDACIY